MGRCMSVDLDVGVVSAADPANVPAAAGGDANVADLAYSVTYKKSPVSLKAECYWFWRGFSRNVYNNSKAPEVAPVKVAATELELEASSSSDDLPQTGCFAEGQGADDLPSIGSVPHESGTCRRCCFFPKGRCANGT